MGDIMSTLSTLGSDVMQGFQGAGQALGDITGFSGGGGPLSPGTLNSVAQNFGAAPNALSTGIDAVANVAPAAASAASTMAAPGIDPINQGAISAGYGAAPTGIPTGDIYNATNPASAVIDPKTGSVIAQPSILDQLSPAATTIAANPVTGINQAVGADVGQGISPSLASMPGAGGSNFLQSLVNNKGLLAALIPAAATFMGATQKPPGLKDIQNLEAQQAGLAKNQGALALGEQGGMLPAGVQSAYQRLLDANLANIRANYAARGLTGSSSEMQDLEAARLDVQDKINKEAENLATTSWKNYGDATKYQSDLLNTIMKAEVEQQTDFRKALADMAAAFTK